jgi:hypothetical protein
MKMKGINIMKVFKKLTLALATFAALFVLTAPLPAQAQDNYNAVCEGLSLTGGDCKQDAGPQIDNIVKNALNIFSIIIGIVAVLMILIGGLKYITSAGDSNSINSAKNTILYAIIGLVIAAFAQLLVQFVLGRTAPKPITSPTTTPAPGTPAAPGAGGNTPAPGTPAAPGAGGNTP